MRVRDELELARVCVPEGNPQIREGSIDERRVRDVASERGELGARPPARVDIDRGVTVGFPRDPHRAVHEVHCPMVSGGASEQRK